MKRTGGGVSRLVRSQSAPTAGKARSVHRYVIVRNTVESSASRLAHFFCSIWSLRARPMELAVMSSSRHAVVGMERRWILEPFTRKVQIFWFYALRELFCARLLQYVKWTGDLGKMPRGKFPWLVPNVWCCVMIAYITAKTVQLHLPPQKEWI